MARLFIIHHVYICVIAWLVLGSCEQAIQSMNGSVTIFFNHQEGLYIYAMNYTMFSEFYKCLSSNQTISCIVSYRNETNLHKVDDVEQNPGAMEVTQTPKQFYGCANDMSVNKFTCERISKGSCSFKRFNSSTYFRGLSNDSNICIGLFFRFSYESLSFSNMDGFKLCSRNQSELLGESMERSLQLPCVQPTTHSFNITQQPNSRGNKDPLPIILGVTGAVLIILVVALVLLIWRRKRLKAKRTNSVVRTETNLDDRRMNALNCYSDNTGTPQINEIRTYNNDNMFENPDVIDVGKVTECSGNLMSETSDKLAASTPNKSSKFSANHNDTDKTQEKENVDVGNGYEVYDPVTSPALKGNTSVRHSQDISLKQADISDTVIEENRKSLPDSPNEDYSHVVKVPSPDVMQGNHTHDYANINLAHSTLEPPNFDASAGQVINEEPISTDETRAGTKPIYYKFGQDRIKSLNPYNSLKDGIEDQDQIQAEAAQLTHNFKRISNEADKANTVQIFELNIHEDPGSLANDYSVLSGEFDAEEKDISAGYLGSGDQRTSDFSAKSYSEYDLIAHEKNVERLRDPIDLSRVSNGIKASIHVTKGVDVTEASPGKISYDYARVQKKVNISVDDTPINKSVERDTVSPEKHLGEAEKVHDLKNSADDYDDAQS